MDPKVLKKTQDTLGKIIKKPPLTEKLLSKPPFRFLHDVMTSVIKTTGFMKGLYTNAESSSENVKDKDSKVAFLQKAFDMVALATGKPIPAKPSKVVAGHDPDKTNEFLQMLAEAINKKVDNDEYVQRVLKGDSGGGKPPAGKEKKERSDRDKDKKREERDKDKKRDRDDDKDKEKRHRSKERDGEDRKGRHDKERGKDREASKDRDRGDRERSGKSKDRERSREKSSDRRHRDRDRDSDKKDRKDESSDRHKDRESSDRHKDRERKKREKEAKQETAPHQEEGEGDKDDDGQEEAKARRPRPNSAKGSRRRQGHGGEDSEEDEEESKPAEKSREHRSGRDQSKMNGTIGEADLPPQVANARKMARPSSARPAPPKPKKAEAGGEPAMIVGSGNVPNVITDKDDSDDDDIFITKEDEPPAPEPEPQHQDVDEDEAGEHGGLVKKILETKKELEGGSQSQQAPKKTEIERSHVNDAQRRKERDMMQKDIDRLRGSIQTLTRSVNPLGKIMDFLQEDLDSMQKELEVWKKENKTNAVALQREQSITESSIEPLKAQLQELDQSINDQLDLIAAVKCNIIKDDDKIEKMLSTLTKS